MANAIFSFDTEDYVNEHAAEGILRTANILKKANITGCYQIVSMLAEALTEWNRFDIIEELAKNHEIDYHSNRHSHHPTINEYTDISNYDLARRIFFDDESAGIYKVKTIFGVNKIPSACPPGNSTSYVARYAYADMGFGIYTGDQIFDAENHRPVFNANIVSLRYYVYLEEMLFDADKKAIEDFVEEISKKDTVVLSHHPQMAYLATFCDLDNYHGSNTPKEKWIKTACRTPEETEKFYENYEYLVSLVKNDSRFNVITYKELYENLKEEKREITKETLLEVGAALSERFFPVTAPNSFCISDVFLACRALLLGKKKHVCKKVYGFLSEPYSVKTETTVTKEELAMAAAGIYTDTFLPEYLFAGDKKIGPADFIWATLAILSGESSYTIKPGMPKQIDLNEFPTLRDLSYKNSWIHSKTLEDNFLSERLRLQAWTIRLPKGTKRFIF
ncbi:MAG: hypothetical protein J6Q68_03465 [Clostridia bacterium]|nr:hypothetical protein [Clostridia bacterium]